MANTCPQQLLAGFDMFDWQQATSVVEVSARRAAQIADNQPNT